MSFLKNKLKDREGGKYLKQEKIKKKSKEKEGERKIARVSNCKPYKKSLFKNT